MTHPQIAQAAKAAFIPSAYQQAIFDWIENGTGNLVVDATAGAGKTSTSVEAARRMPGVRVGFFAFNKHSAADLQNRLPEGSTAMTIHSLGSGALYRAGGKTNLDDTKYKTIATRLLLGRGWDAERTAGFKETETALVKLASFARLTLTDERDRAGLAAMADTYNLEIDWDILDGALDLLPEVFAASLRLWDTERLIDFTDMIFLPVRLNLPTRTFAFVIIDEAQDLNRCQSKLVLKAVRRGGRVAAIGDRNQSLYAFAGADHTSMDRLKAELNAAELPLSVCYRCPKSVVQLAQRLVPTMEWAEGAIDGLIGTLDREGFTQHLTAGDLVLCRTTAPLVRGAFECLRAGIPAQIRGRDIAAGLKAIVTKIGERKGFSMAGFVDALGAYADREKVKILGRHKGDAEAAGLDLEALGDKVAVLEMMYAEHAPATPEALNRALDNLFSDKDDASLVTFSSIHRAKGLEAKRVYILRRDLMPHPRATREADLIQERNAEFVALTRPQEELWFVIGDEAEAA